MASDADFSHATEPQQIDAPTRVLGEHGLLGMESHRSRTKTLLGRLRSAFGKVAAFAIRLGDIGEAVTWLKFIAICLVAILVILYETIYPNPDCNRSDLDQRATLWCAYKLPPNALPEFRSRYEGKRVTWKGRLVQALLEGDPEPGERAHRLLRWPRCA
jgi:hypothetical protein